MLGNVGATRENATDAMTFHSVLCTSAANSSPHQSLALPIIWFSPMPSTRLDRITQMQQQAQASHWLPIAALSARLGISPKTIKRRRDEGVFRLGTHYRLVGSPNARRPAYLYHLPKCAQAVGIPLD